MDNLCERDVEMESGKVRLIKEAPNRGPTTYLT